MPEILTGLLWIAVALALGAGVGIYIRSRTYRTCGFCLIMLGSMMAVYRLIFLLRPQYPLASDVLIWCVSIPLALFLLMAGITGFCIIRTAVTKPRAGYPYLVVLGCVVKGKTPTSSLRDRITGAYEYLRKNPQTRCIVSGALGPKAQITEAECMFRELIVLGIEPERIVLEEQARNTWQNLQFSAEIITRETGSRPGEIAVVTSEYHLFRTGIMARRQNLQLLPVPAATGRFILRLNYTLREIGAVWRMLLKR